MNLLFFVEFNRQTIGVLEENESVVLSIALYHSRIAPITDEKTPIHSQALFVPVNTDIFKIFPYCLSGVGLEKTHKVVGRRKS